MKKQLASVVLALAVSMGVSLSALAADSADMPAGDKLAAMEKMLYGTTQSGSLVQRMDSMEDDVYGTVLNNGILERIDNMYAYLEGDDKSEASFNTQLNMVEWKFQSTMSDEPAKTRIEKLEKYVNGSAIGGSLSERLAGLEKLASYNIGKIPVQTVTLPKDNVLKIEFLQELSTKQNRAGDVVDFKAADNLYVNNVLVIPKGARGNGTVKKVVQPGIFGKDGRIDITFTSITAIDNEQVPVTVGDLSKQKANSVAGASAATIGGLVILGPIGVVGGAFVKGNSVVIPAGSFTYVQTVEDTTLQGVAIGE